jgi:tetraacyldisaccharide 4'-kinase
MQYLPLHRRVEICRIDRQSPFGNEHLLPRGTLREPPANLSRANYIFLTKSDGSDSSELIERIRQYNPTAGIVETTHQALHLRNLYADEELPLDPWGHPYEYRDQPAAGQDFTLYSLGADGEAGGEGMAADIGYLP